MASTAESLTKAFNILLERDFGQNTPPDPYLTPTGIRHLDTLLGGGFASSLPIMISSVPESGKSSIAFQFAAQFQRVNPNSVILYLDVEASANVSGLSKFVESRMDTFGIDKATMVYKPLMLNVKEMFEVCKKHIELKREIERRTNTEVPMLIVLDSLAAVPSSKDMDSDDVNSTIGLKAREISFYLTQLKTYLAMNKVTMIIIDQVRANMQISSPYAARDEKTVGHFGNVKSATSINSLQHAIHQWLFLSKGTALTPNDGFGVDGFIVNVFIEKNKIAQSNSSVPLVFDRKFGAIPILSEYLFMSEMTKTEIKNTKKVESKLVYPLCVESVARSKVIKIIDPDTLKVIRESDKFTERNLIQKYNSDPKFKEDFDTAIMNSIEGRIVRGLFRSRTSTVQSLEEDDETSTDEFAGF
jgi:RecA/RadA recombinase